MGNLLENLHPKASRFETIIWTAKLILILVGIVSTFFFFKVAIIPYSFSLIFSMFSSLPKLWIFFRSWLSPPYIYILLNFIIISIAASSTFHHQNDQSSKSSTQPAASGITKTSSHSTEKYKDSSKSSQSDDDIWSYTSEYEEAKDENPTLAAGKSADPSPQTCSEDDLTGNHHHRIVPVAAETPKMEENDQEAPETIEDTWKLITQGPRKAQLKKSETWDTPPRVMIRAAALQKLTSDGHVSESSDDDDHDPATWARREMRKSETFNGSISKRREKSMTHDELYARADAFIKKINNEMRLERLVSQQRRMAMIN